jgi:Rad3-related DNA helicase
MCGRIMRSDSDWGITYILDSTAVGLLFGNKEMLPYWFKERINYVRGEIPLEFKR